MEAFADAWFGANDGKIRESLNRPAKGPYPLPSCEGCVNFFAPRAGKCRKALIYADGKGTPQFEPQLDPGSHILIEGIQAETGFCHIARIPGDTWTSELWEDELKLGREVHA